jgi:2,4-diaminopentanoate dehydrogenase
MPTRIISWATGKVGEAIARELLGDPRYELVGALVYGEPKDGLDLGEIVGRAPIGVTATRDKERIFALPADVVIHAPIGHKRSDEHDRDVVRLLESGKNVISTRGWFNCRAFGEDYARKMEDACVKGGVTLAGLGMTPGFVAERLATTLTGAMLDLDHLTVSEAYDCTPLFDGLLRRMGFGMSPAEYEASPISSNYDDMYSQVAWSVVETFGRRPDRVDARHSFVLAENDVRAGALAIPRGTVQGTIRRWVAIVEGKPLFTMEYRWFVGPIAGWPEQSGWTITTDGRPRFRMTLAYEPTPDHDERTMGYEMLSAVVIRAIEPVVAAPAGLFATPIFAPYTERRQ